MNLVRLLILSLVASLSGCAVIAQTPTAGSVGLTVKNVGAGSTTQWIPKAANSVLGWNSEGQLVALSGGAGGGTWGSITGTLSAQTDLQNALNAKLAASAAAATYEPLLPAGGGEGQYLRGDKTWQVLDASTVGLGNVEDVSLSSWGGSPNIYSVGTITSGVWSAQTIALNRGGTGATTASNARTNLGLVIGLHVLAPNGNGSALIGLNASALSSGTVATARLGTGTANSGTFLRGDGTWAAISGGGDALTSAGLGQFAATTSADLRGVLSDETGTGAAVFAGGNIGNASGGNVELSGYLRAPSIYAINFVSIGNDGHQLYSGGGEFNSATLPGYKSGFIPLVADSGGLVSLSADVTGTLPIANGGTGSTTASGARTALGLAIGSDVQAYNVSTTTLGNSATGTGSIVRASSPTLTTPVIGAATGTSLSLSGSLSASNFSGSSTGTNTGDQTVTLTGDVTGSGTGSFSTTLANSGVVAGTYVSANITVDAKGRVTSASDGSGGGGGSGPVKQVMTAFKGDPQTTTTVNGSWTDVTDMSFTITLTDASHSVLLDAQVSVGYVNGNSGTALRWVRKGSPDVALSVATDTSGRWETGTGPTLANDNNATFVNNIKAIDAPGSVGPHTYQLQFCASAVTTATAYINRSSSDSNTNAYSSRPSSVAFLWEVDL